MLELFKLFKHELKTTSLTEEIIETLYNDRVSNPVKPSELEINNSYTIEDFNTVEIIENDVQDIIDTFYCSYYSNIEEIKVMLKDGSSPVSIELSYNSLMDEYEGSLQPTLQDIVNGTFTLNDFMENHEYLGILYKKSNNIDNTSSLFDSQINPTSKLTKKDLSKEQKKTVKFICKKKTVQLNLGMGFGKTASTLTAISKLIKKDKIKNALVIAPKQVSSNVWGNEVKEWSHLNHLTVIEIVNVKQFIDYEPKTYDVTIVNVHILDKFLTYIKRFKFSMVVFDESTLFKSHNSLRFKSTLKYLNMVNPKYRVNLTGTPMPNGYGNLFSQYKLLDGGKRLGKYVTHFRESFMESDYMGYNWRIRDNAIKKLHKIIKPITLSFKPKDIVKQPLNYVFDNIPMSAKLKKRYNDLKKHNLLELEGYDFNDPSTFIQASTNGILNNKLLQFANGSIKNTETDEIEHIHNLKLDYLKDFMRDYDGNVIVMYSHVSDKEKLLDTFKYAKTSKVKNLQDSWNNGNIKMLISHPASIGHGLNLQYGGCLIIWYGLTYDLELYQQTNKRLHRRGQLNPVIIKHLIVGDVEEKLVKALNKKAKAQDKIMKVGKK